MGRPFPRQELQMKDRRRRATRMALLLATVLGLGMAWVVWLAWRITRFLISPRRTIP